MNVSCIILIALAFMQFTNAQITWFSNGTFIMSNQRNGGTDENLNLFGTTYESNSHARGKVMIFSYNNKGEQIFEEREMTDAELNRYYRKQARLKNKNRRKSGQMRYADNNRERRLY
ncbi:hypothetical protein ACFFRR_003599 [Megaselia abdita]